MHGSPPAASLDLTDAMEQKSTQAYQVIAQLLDRCGMYYTDEGVRALDYFSNELYVNENFLPFPRDWKWPRPSPDHIERFARAWASIDGRLEAFDREKDGAIPCDDPTYTGHHEGYIEDAKELLERALP